MKIVRKIFLLLFLTGITASACGQISQDKVADGQEWSLRRMVGQMVVTGFRGMDAEGEEIRHAVQELGVGGVIYFDRDVPTGTDRRNIRSPEQLRELSEALQELAPVPLLICIDQEGGQVSRLKEWYGFPATVSAARQGMRNDPAATAGYAARTAHTLAGVGINVDFAPCVDVNVNPACPVIGRRERSFSADPEQVALHAGIWVEQLNRRGIVTSLKHFPGHGSSTVDSHIGLPDITRTWQRDTELAPYRALIRQGYDDMVMVGHLMHREVDPDYPASLSRVWITDILRGELGFGGVVVTDDLNMGAIVENYSLETALEKSINAGVDMIILGNNGPEYEPELAARAVDIICALVEEGKISPERIAEACGRILELKVRFFGDI